MDRQHTYDEVTRLHVSETRDVGVSICCYVHRSSERYPKHGAVKPQLLTCLSACGLVTNDTRDSTLANVTKLAGHQVRINTQFDNCLARLPPL